MSKLVSSIREAVEKCGLKDSTAFNKNWLESLN